LLAFDKFKDTISSEDICDAIKSKINERHEFKGFNILEVPISDGGDGFIKCLHQQFKELPYTELKHLKVLDPLMRPIEGTYLINKKTKTAYLEVANTSGLALLKKEERNPYFASSIVTIYFT
jgi:glycerate kinase